MRFVWARLLFLPLLCTVHSYLQPNTNWLSFRGLRQTAGIVYKNTSSLLYCGTACSHLYMHCYAFNYHRGSRHCEVMYLNADSVVVRSPKAELGWTFYVREDFVQKPCSFPVCKIGSICLLYPDRFAPDYFTAPTAIWPRYTCSSHSFLISKQQAGLTNCRFDQLENTALWGYDIPPYNPANESYVDVFGYCDLEAGNPCAAVESQPGGVQYLKNQSHLSQAAVSLRSFPGVAYFYADCYL